MDLPLIKKSMTVVASATMEELYDLMYQVENMFGVYGIPLCELEEQANMEEIVATIQKESAEGMEHFFVLQLANLIEQYGEKEVAETFSKVAKQTNSAIMLGYANEQEDVPSVTVTREALQTHYELAPFVLAWHQKGMHSLKMKHAVQ